VTEAVEFFKVHTSIRTKMETLAAVGLGYIRLGQPATTLSGGEAQRVKLSTELSRRSTGRTFYILDEPTTGLSFEDTAHLLTVLQRLVDGGNTVLVIEHNLDVIKCADWIDLRPAGDFAAARSWRLPEDVARVATSTTGHFPPDPGGGRHPAAADAPIGSRAARMRRWAYRPVDLRVRTSSQAPLARHERATAGRRDLPDD
jgi:excinuclease ABC subunit A